MAKPSGHSPPLLSPGFFSAQTMFPPKRKRRLLRTARREEGARCDEDAGGARALRLLRLMFAVHDKLLLGTALRDLATGS